MRYVLAMMLIMCMATVVYANIDGSQNVDLPEVTSITNSAATSADGNGALTCPDFITIWNSGNAVITYSIQMAETPTGAWVNGTTDRYYNPAQSDSAAFFVNNRGARYFRFHAIANIDSSNTAIANIQGHLCGGK